MPLNIMDSIRSYLSFLLFPTPPSYIPLSFQDDTPSILAHHIYDVPVKALRQ